MYIDPQVALLVVSTAVIAAVGIYLVLVLHRVLKTLKAVNLLTDLIEKFRNTKSITDKIPFDKIRAITDHLPDAKPKKKRKKK